MKTNPEQVYVITEVEQNVNETLMQAAMGKVLFLYGSDCKRLLEEEKIRLTPSSVRFSRHLMDAQQNGSFHVTVKVTVTGTLPDDFHEYTTWFYRFFHADIRAL